MHLRYTAALALAALLASTAAIADTGFVANINSAQEVPVNASTGTGNGYMVLNNAQNSLSYNISFTGLTGNHTAAHFHGPAAPGVNAGVRFLLSNGGGASGNFVGAWAILPADVTSLLNQLLYVNIHTLAFPGGEIRGQVVLDATPTSASTWGRIKQLYR